MQPKQFQRALPAKALLATLQGDGVSGVLEFTNIPQSYRHLNVVLSGRTTANVLLSSCALWLTFETSPTAGTYNRQYVQGSKTTVSASEDLGVTDAIFLMNMPGSDSPANLHRGTNLHVYEYAKTDVFKNALSLVVGGIQILDTGFPTTLVNGVWESTAAINRIRLSLGSGAWTTTSRASLYGVR